MKSDKRTHLSIIKEIGRIEKSEIPIITNKLNPAEWVTKTKTAFKGVDKYITDKSECIAEDIEFNKSINPRVKRCLKAIDTEKNDSDAKEDTNTVKKESLPQKEKTNEDKKSHSKEEKNIEKREFHPVENYHPENDRHLHSKGIRIFGISILVFIILLSIAFFIFTFLNSKNENIISGVSIKGIDVSNLSVEEAKETLQNFINENLPENITLVHNDYETSIPLSALNVNFDIDSAVNQAYATGKSGNIFENSFIALKTKIDPIDIELSATLDEEQLRTALNDISSKLPDTVIESGYYIEGNDLIVTKGSEGNVVNVDQMCTYIKSGISNLTLKNRTLDIATVSKQPSAIDIEKIYNEIYKQPVDAYYTQDPFAVYPSENGLDFAISLDEAKNMLLEEKDEYVIPLQTLYPNVTTNMIGTEAFPDMLSTYSTRYSTSDRDRTTNLQLAASKINGTVLMPGETFSYNQVVGERTIAAGYKEAPIYVSGEVVDGLGGGICQITSTLYNAVLYANLEIVERSNHQFVPSYVKASRDATVVYGSIDFKFKNNRDYPIKLVCSVSGGIAKFDIYGLRTDNEYDVEISSYVTGSTANSTYSEAYRILKQNGQVVSTELLSKDVYKRH